MDYTEIKLLAADLGKKVSDLIALAPANDPFYAGTPGDWQLARWFSALWHKFGYSDGVHIRRVHYQIISQNPPVIMPNGLPYENTDTCWGVLNQASKMARYLNLVDPGAFVDRRNPEPHLFTDDYTSIPEVGVDRQLFGIPALPDFPELPEYAIQGFYGRQGYHIEVWCEKSTMNDVLLPLCQRYDMNLVTGLGEMSITATMQLAERFTDRPVRIFYVSDFDPAGMSIPCSVARKVEYFQRSCGFDADVKIFSLVLTEAQVRKYRLPRTPIKESERRGAKFEDRFGTGAVELDALEALYPGELERILLPEIKRYFDNTLARRVSGTEQTLRNALTTERIKIQTAHVQEITNLLNEYKSLKAQFDAQFGDYGNRLHALWQEMSDEMEDRKPDIDDYPVPQARAGDERDNALYDSDRDYIEQIEFYKQFQGKE